MHAMRRALPLTLAGTLAALAVLAVTAPTARAAPPAGGISAARAAAAGRTGPARPAVAAYSAPSGAWKQFISDLNGAEGLASGRGVTVALLSTGVDTGAMGLSGTVTQGPNYIKKATPSPHSVGTISASLIAGVPRLLQGAAPDSKILSLRVIPDQSESGATKFFDSGSYDDSESKILAKAITYAVAHGARVIQVDAEIDSQAAFGGLASAVSDAVAKGAVIVAPEQAVGTLTTNFYAYPAALPGVIGVASVMLPGGLDPARLGVGRQADQSVRNNSVLIAGPGDWVPATPEGWGPYGVGTAAPYVVATVAMIKQRYPSLSPALVVQALAMSARHKPGGGYSTNVGFGILDPYDAVLDAGTLIRHMTVALPGPGVVGARARFGSGPPPGAVSALPSATPQIIASGAGIVVGAALLVLALVLAVRGRRRRRRGQRALGPQTPGPQAIGPHAVGPPNMGPPPGQYPAPPRYPGPQPPAGAPQPPAGGYPGQPGWLQQPAQAEQVLHARLDLHLARHPGARDVHRRLGEGHHLIAVRRHPDVGRRATGFLLGDRIVAGAEPSRAAS
jgi:hypothetical protein